MFDLFNQDSESHSKDTKSEIKTRLAIIQQNEIKEQIDQFNRTQEHLFRFLSKNGFSPDYTGFFDSIQKFPLDKQETILNQFNELTKDALTSKGIHLQNQARHEQPVETICSINPMKENELNPFSHKLTL